MLLKNLKQSTSFPITTWPQGRWPIQRGRRVFGQDVSEERLGGNGGYIQYLQGRRWDGKDGKWVMGDGDGNGGGTHNRRASAAIG